MMNTISISKFNQEILDKAVCYRDDLMITDQIENIDQFKYPCRIDAITILICADGEIDLSINLKDFNMKSNGILVNFPENIIRIDKTRGLKAYVMLISPDFLKQLQIDLKQKLNSYFNLKQFPLTYTLHDEIAPLKYYYELFKDSITDIKTESPNIIRGLVFSFIFKIISIINCHHEFETEKTSESKKSIQQSFENFMFLLSMHHDKERSVQFYADKMHLTPNYLSKIVKEYSGKTSTQWISEYVILEAKTLLKFSGKNVQQIAYQLNFPSQSSFGKYFKQQTGLSPKSYMEADENQE